MTGEGDSGSPHGVPEIAGIALRPVEEGDGAFLRALYRSTREQELALTGWPEETRRAFSDSQFALQEKAYAENYPGAARLVIVREGAAIGRLYLHRRAGELRIMDIALAEAERGRGLGTRILEAILGGAAGEGLEVSLHVESFNPARRFYARLGFAEATVDGIYLMLRWKPPGRG